MSVGALAVFLALAALVVWGAWYEVERSTRPTPAPSPAASPSHTGYTWAPSPSRERTARLTVTGPARVEVTLHALGTDQFVTKQMPTPATITVQGPPDATFAAVVSDLTGDPATVLTCTITVDGRRRTEVTVRGAYVATPCSATL